VLAGWLFVVCVVAGWDGHEFIKETEVTLGELVWLEEGSGEDLGVGNGHAVNEVHGCFPAGVSVDIINLILGHDGGVLVNSVEAGARESESE
jgi:hypothetical protein